MKLYLNEINKMLNNYNQQINTNSLKVVSRRKKIYNLYINYFVIFMSLKSIM